LSGSHDPENSSLENIGQAARRSRDFQQFLHVSRVV
jgi:hypothetical protein